MVIGRLGKKTRVIACHCRGGKSRILTATDRGGGHFSLWGQN